MMKSVLRVYRILLPPLLLCRLCLPRPSETESGLVMTDDIVQLHGGSSEAQTNLEGLSFQMTVKHINENGSLRHDNIDTGAWNLERNQKAPSLVSMTTRINLNTIEKEFQKRRDSRSSTSPFRYQQINQWTQFNKQRKKVHKSTPELSIKENTPTYKYWINQHRVSVGQKLSDTNFEHSLVSMARPSNNSRSNQIIRNRIKRSPDDVSVSNRLEHRSPHQIPPEYMVRLFQLLSGTHFQMMRNVVVTGFVNINDEEDYLDGSGSILPKTHELVFDVSIRQDIETMQYAELRLYLILKNRDTGTQYDSDIVWGSMSRAHDISVFEVDTNNGHRLIAEKNIHNAHRKWVSLNVTSAVQQWPAYDLHVLEVRISISENNTDAGGNNSDFAHDSALDLVLDIETAQGKDPLLLVFSKKTEAHESIPIERDKRATRDEQEQTERLYTKNVKDESNKSNYTYVNNELATSGQYFEGLVNFVSTISTDSSNHRTTRKLQVSQKYHSKTNADYSRNFVDKKKIVSFNNVSKVTFMNFTSNTQNLTVNQSLAPENRSHKTRRIHLRDTRNVTFMRQQHAKEKVESTPAKKESATLSKRLIRTRVRREAKSRYRRHLESLFREQMSKSGPRFKRSKKKRNSCQRDEMYVDFETIKWDKVIIFPRGYQAFECTGKCYTPISEYLTPTKHAIIQTLVHTSYPEQASRACCVPTKLDPISILYWDDNGDIKYDYSYEGMVVAECGCR